MDRAVISTEDISYRKRISVVVNRSHFLQEEAPAEVGEATARFVSKVLAGQIS